MPDRSISLVLDRAEAHLARVATGPALLALRQALAPEGELARRHPAWPVVRLPLTVHTALGGEPDAGTELAAACALFFASADVTDDAQDGDLAPGAFGDSWQQAVNAGHALIFLSQAVATAATAARHRGRVAEAFAAAGLAMSLGQARDLAQRGADLKAVGEAAYLETIRGKAGASFRLYAALGAIALGRSPRLVAALQAYGEAFGTAVQLASDLTDLAGPDSRDQRNRQPTLPVIAAWHRLSPGDRPMFLASWRGEAGAVPLSFFLERTGATRYAQARLAALSAEAELALETRAMPRALARELGDALQAVGGSRAGNLA